MAGFRDFQTGEVLTAANVNDFLMQQSVMKFADATARDTALGTAVGGSNALREGMVAYLDDTDEVQYYGGTAWAAVSSDPNPGIGTNVVQAVKTDTFTTTSTSMVDLTGLSVTITPSSATSKILVVADVSFSNTTNSVGTLLNLVRDSTDIFQPTGGSSSNTTMLQAGSNNTVESRTAVFLDSPATASAVTYKLQIAAVANTAVVNRRSTTDRYVASSITAIEVAA